MSNADEAVVRYALESTYGTLPGTAYGTARTTSCGLQKITGTTQSAELVADRQVADLIRTGINTNGDIGIEFTADTFDQWFQSGMFAAVGAWPSSTALASGASVTMTPATGTIAATGIHTNAVAGQWIVCSDFASSLAAANGKWFKIITVGTDLITVAGATLLPSGTDTGDVEMAGQIVNGTTSSSWSIEVESTDLTNVIQQFVGQQIESFGLTIPSSGPVTGQFSWFGKTMDKVSTSDASSVVAATTTKPMNAIDHVLAINAGIQAVNNASAFGSTQFSFNCANNLRPRNEIATLGPVSLGAGKHVATGTLQAYFKDSSQLQTYLDFTETALSVGFSAADGTMYLFEWPAVKFSADPVVAQGENTDMIEDLTWTAYKHSTEGITTRIAKFG